MDRRTFISSLLAAAGLSSCAAVTPPATGAPRKKVKKQRMKLSLYRFDRDDGWLQTILIVEKDGHRSSGYGVGVFGDLRDCHGLSATSEVSGLIRQDLEFGPPIRTEERDGFCGHFVYGPRRTELTDFEYHCLLYAIHRMRDCNNMPRDVVNEVNAHIERAA